MSCNCDKDSNGTLECPIHGYLVDEEVEQKTFDSEPTTPEEMAHIKHMLTQEDQDAGFHNIDVPEDFKEEEPDPVSLSRILPAENDTDPIQRTDIIRVDMTPEQLAFTIEAMKRVSWKESDLEYFYNDTKESSQYEDIAKIRKLVDSLEFQFNEYVVNRPFTPWLKPWLNRIYFDTKKGKF